MNRNSKRTTHWIVEMNRRNRTRSGLLLFATLAAHMVDKGFGLSGWCLLVLQFLVYPQAVYFLANASKEPRKAEMANLALDGFFFGVWAAALGFPVWITFIFFVTVSVNLTVFHGKRGFWQAIASMLAGALLTILFTGLRIAPETNWLATMLSIITVSAYVLIVADNAFARAVKLHETRKQLKSGEYALKQQLEEINRLQSSLREQAHRDPLTGLYNRRYVDATLERELARCKREGQPLSLVIIDIDHFKQINDSCGHQAGDEVLKALASLLNEHVRASDVACRYGGEEFCWCCQRQPQALPTSAPSNGEQHSRRLRSFSIHQGYWQRFRRVSQAFQRMAHQERT